MKNRKTTLHSKRRARDMLHYLLYRVCLFLFIYPIENCVSSHRTRGKDSVMILRVRINKTESVQSLKLQACCAFCCNFYAHNY